MMPADIVLIGPVRAGKTMHIQRFQGTIIKSDSKTMIVIPFNPNEVWGEKQKYHVTGSINGMKYRGPLGFDGNQNFLSLGAAWCRDQGVQVGQKVEVELTPEGPQSDSLSPDIAAALDYEPQARILFESLATFYRNGYIKWVEGARRPETRQARITEMIGLLKAGL